MIAESRSNSAKNTVISVAPSHTPMEYRLGIPEAFALGVVTRGLDASVLISLGPFAACL